jgi:hypothetical protein
MWTELDEAARDESEGGEGAPAAPYRTLIYVALCCRDIAERGFVGRAQAARAAETACEGDPSRRTTSMVADILYAEARNRRGEIVEARWVTEAQRVLDWVREWGDASDYAHNVRTVCAEETVHPKGMGILASAPQAMYRALGEAAKRERPTRPESRYVGTIGAKVELRVTVTRVSSYDSQWGGGVAIAMATAEGDELVWFTGRRPEGADEGAEMTLSGTVKGHSERHGRRQTAVTRCRLAK